MRLHNSLSRTIPEVTRKQAVLLYDRLLWLRNHYEARGDPAMGQQVLADVDRVLEQVNPLVEQAKLEPLHAVLVTGSGHFAGRVGMTVEELGDGAWRVQFGAGGPFQTLRASSLRYATAREVEEAGLHGTGFKIRGEED